MTMIYAYGTCEIKAKTPELFEDNTHHTIEINIVLTLVNNKETIL